jgi:DNA uptake protein ComE-like DNA-binding protein
VTTLVGATWLLIVSPRGGEAPAPVPLLVVDPNTAPPRILMALPRLGPSLVGRIVAARAEAPFRSIDDLDARVRGLGPATIKALRPHLRIGPAEIRGADRSLSSAPTMAHNAR